MTRDSTSPQKKKTVLCVGHCTLDTIGVVDRFNPPGTKSELDQFTIQGGGSAATAGVALARLGVEARFIGATGDDERGALIRRTLSESSVDVDGVVVQRGAVSQFTFVITEGRTGQRQTFWTRGTLTPLSLDDVPMSVLDDVDALHIDGYHPGLQLSLAREARRRGLPVFFDASNVGEHTSALVAQTRYLIASERFASEFSGVGQLEASLSNIMEHGPEVVLITMGAEGSIGRDTRGTHAQPPMRLEREQDSTGAGDIYRGAFIYASITGAPLPEAMSFATAAATLSLRSLGGRGAIPTMEEIQALMKETARA